ncbi:MAG: outer membrane beta-barrel protein [Saprospiraceae bacterium]
MKFVYTCILLLLTANLFSQDLTLSGTIKGAENSEALIGAYIFLQHPWGEEYKATTTGADGKFKFEEVYAGGYKLKVTYIGYQTYEQEITFSQNKDLGSILLEEGAVDLDQVVVKEKIPLAQQLEDTTQYNANAFKTLQDASAEELIEKMPGVLIEDGKVQAQGEDVKQVLVDGRPFFGNDPNAALKNLPAEVISQIQVYDQQSEQAQFSGFEDGETTKTINIITKPGMNNGKFGKVYAGYGYENKYQLGGNTNFFDGDRRISIIGQSNNINIQNFATEDILGVVGSTGRGGRRGGGRGRGGRRGGGGSSVNDFLVNANNGIATTNALGLNYSDKFGEKTEVTGSYFFNWTETDEEEILDRMFVSGRTNGQTYTESSNSNSTNSNHRINMQWRINLDSANRLTIRPKLNLQFNDGSSETIGETRSEETLLNFSNNEFTSDLVGATFSNQLNWQHKFKKRGRTFSISTQTEYSDNEGESNQYALNGFEKEELFENDTLDQFADLLTTGWKLSSRFSYTEPVGERSQLSIDYRNSWQKDESEQETFDFVDADEEYTALNEDLSSVFNNVYTTHQFGGGYRYSKGRELRIMLRGFVQHASLKSDELFPVEDQINRTYYSFLPMASLRYRFSRSSNLRFFYRANTDNPTVSQLQNVLNNSNPLDLSIGNPVLDQSVQHRLGFRYSNTNTTKATVFYFNVSGTYTKDYIGNSTYLRETDNPIFEELEFLPGAQLSQPVNLDGYYNLRSYLTYGMPLKNWKVNMNFDFNGSFTRTPGLLDEELNYANNSLVGGGLTLSSNISDKLDFTISSRSNFNQVNNSLAESVDERFLSQQSSFKLGWVLPLGIVIRTQLTHQYFWGLGEAFNEDYLLWNASIGKKIFKNQRGEISLSVFDLLNQNRKINRNVTDVYVEDIQTNVLQRYLMLKFQYTFLNYNAGRR